ncbi:MAG: ATP-binding protein [Methylococcaceae bacterium]|nr:ATP-binding protein [Methylococcaceae bacterium]
MKRYMVLLIRLVKMQFRLYLAAAFIGGVVGILIFYPLYDFVYFHEHGVENMTAFDYISGRFIASLQGHTPIKTWFIAKVGIVFGVVLAWVYGKLHKKLAQIEQLTAELQRDLKASIQQGEGPLLEFKSSFRWDYQQACTNKNIETAVIKTLAGFMNSHVGGTLLIGIADDGKVLGLENDFNTLRRKDSDGYEQLLMTTIASSLGARFCQYIHVMFHLVNENYVCRLIVNPSPHPVFFKQNKDAKFYLRTGGGTRDLNIEDATDYISQRWGR